MCLFEYVCRYGVQVVGEVVGKYSRDMQALSVVLRRLIDAGGERLRQREDSAQVVYLPALHKDRNLGEVVYQFGFAEGLEEVHNPCVRERVAEDRNRHRTRCVEVEGGAKVGVYWLFTLFCYLLHYLQQCFITNGVDVDIGSG